MNKKSQKLGNEAIGFQADRDVIIHNGIDITELEKVIQAQSSSVVLMAAFAAREAAQERVDELMPKIIERITSQHDSSPEALKDPDFHYALLKAEQAYARSGEENVGDILVDLIGRRATQGKRTRLALTLNDSIERVSALTSNEFAILSLVYILRYTRSSTITTYEKFIEWAESHVLPYINDLPDHNNSIQYLDAQSCGRISLNSANLHRVIVQKYPGVFSKGFDSKIILATIPEEHKSILYDTELFIPCFHDTEKLQVAAHEKNVLLEFSRKKQIPDTVIDSIWAHFESTFMSQEEMIKLIGERLPGFITLDELWKKCQLSNFELNTVGIAIGHANARRVGSIDADLSIWIK